MTRSWVTPASLRALYGVEVDVVAIPGPGGRSTRVCVPSLAVCERWPATR